MISCDSLAPLPFPSAPLSVPLTPTHFPVSPVAPSLFLQVTRDFCEEKCGRRDKAARVGEEDVMVSVHVASQMRAAVIVPRHPQLPSKGVMVSIA